MQKLFLIAIISLVLCFEIDAQEKPKVIVTTDMGADPDDQQSMVRFLVQSNEFDVKGLIVSTSCWKTTQSTTNMNNYMTPLLNAYETAYPNLVKHSSDFPSPTYLRSVTVLGNTAYGMAGVGSGKDSPGSSLIIATVDAASADNPIWVQSWGGSNTLAQALWKVKNTRTQAQVDEFVSKVHCYDILGQDDSGAWIVKTFPNMIYIRATNVYGWQPSDSWIDNNVQNHGALGAVYPNRKYATEGDSPAFFYVMYNGLNNPAQPWQGGWGGRFGRNKVSGIRSMSQVAKISDETQYDPYYMYGNEAGPQKWQPAINNDFQARMDWSVSSNYSSVNHHPVVVANGDQTRKVLVEYVKPGTSFNISASGTSDPDGNSLSYNWFYYEEAGTYDGSVAVNSSAVSQSIQIPSDASGKEIHIVLEVHDNGSPNLYMYRRIVFKVTNTLPIVVNISSPADGEEFESGDIVNITATAQSDQGSVTQVEFFVDGTSVGTDNTSPYTATFTASDASHIISAVANDNIGGEGSDAVSINVNIPQEPYGGTSHAIPGKIEAEFFDLGGNGFAYYDATPGSATGHSFRNDEDVDIEDCTDNGGGYNLGYWTAGEWLEYTVDVANSGTYDLELRVASNDSGRTINIGMGNTQIAENITIPNTGGWQAWQTVTVKNVQLIAGEQVMRVTMGDTDYVNLNYISFNAISGNQYPIANAGADITVVDSDNSGSETLSLDGSASNDPDGTIESYLWTEGGSQIATGATPSVSLAVGTHVITLIVTDNEGATSTSIVTITVQPKSNNNTVWLEAECGAVGSLWQTLSDANASNETYMTIQSGDNSTGSAPSDTNGHISYTFNVSENGDYAVWARVITPNGEDDSFWLQMDGGSWSQWNQIGPNSNWTWEASQTYNLNAGTHTFTVAYREDGALLDKLYITNTGNAPTGEGSAASNCEAQATSYAWLEAECGTVGSLFNVGDDVNASNAAFVSVISGNNSTSNAPYESSGWITLPFTLSETGTYSLWCRVICPSPTDDSFWIKMDNGAFSMWNNITPSTSWTWAQYPITFDITTTGDHTLTIGYREDGAQIDKLYITKAGDTPSGAGSSAQNLCSPALKFSQNAEINMDNSIAEIQIFPNPVYDKVNIEGAVPSTEIRLFKSNGSLMLNMNATDAHATIDMSPYLPGLYFIQLTSSDGNIVTEKLIKK